jgi:hypothetical protein
MSKANEIILAFIGEPTSPTSSFTSTCHGYDAFVSTEHKAIWELFKSLCMWGGPTKSYMKSGNYYSYFELDCQHKEFFKSDIFKRICKPYNVTITIYEDGKELYNGFYKDARTYPYH